MGIQYSVQALTQTPEKGLELHPKYKKYLKLNCPDFYMESCMVTKRMREIVLENWEFISTGQTTGMKAKVPEGSSPVVFFYDFFYSALFNVCPEVKPLFRSSIIVQGKALISIVQTVTNESNVDHAIEKVVDLAYRHNKYKVKMRYYNVLGLTLLDSIKECYGENFTDEMTIAWKTVYAFMMTAMTPILYHGTIEPTEKEKQLAKMGKYMHSITIRRTPGVEPATLTSINPGQCPVMKEERECPVKK